MTHGLGWFALPAAVIFALITLVPSVQGVRYAFTDWDGISTDVHFVGLDQFRQIWSIREVRSSVSNTLVYAMAITVVQNLVGLLLALGASARIRCRNLIRVLLFAPAVMSPVAAAYIWRHLLSTDGPINSGLHDVGLSAIARSWLGDPDTAIAAVTIVVIWQFAGYSMVIYLGGLDAIPHEVLEAAEIDGAGAWARFWYVKRPMLKPAITVTVVLSLIGGLTLFDQILILTNGGPVDASESMSTVIFKQAFQYGQFGLSTAVAVVLTIVVAVVAVVQYRVMTREQR